ncbi:unnamed protein product [Clonostachys rosea]|uniref:Uncharacterized protein n=1 Tax=Bionectria ochroleuca TaxID=29856 RepID=A0ABY6U108_BIOOC|nr:unnamed protein product [Clonostachys rosea]
MLDGDQKKHIPGLPSSTTYLQGRPSLRESKEGTDGTHLTFWAPKNAPSLDKKAEIAGAQIVR